MRDLIFRFAPSPNGHLHLGHAFSALVSQDMAKKSGGRFLLRIEDIDVARCRPGFEAQMLDDLTWLGLDWERPVRRQSEHFDTYRSAIGKLEQMGLVYPCFASRKDISEHAVPGKSDPDGAPLYPGLHKELSIRDIARRKAAGEHYAMRLDMDKAIVKAQEISPHPLTFREMNQDMGDAETVIADPARWGDAVVARKDVPTSYHLSVVVDDALQGITHVTRGRDLFAATDIHRLLQVLLGLPEPVYHHHALLTAGDGRKLSKSHGDRSLKNLREEGMTVQDIRKMIAEKVR
ncbi:MAG: tRNA glutamyl-Q(34) synthetase GluQRS [Hyphomicrobiaceae bacterium]|nr:tRNA glutamyl-Q(34) synthetase GluQRS [Hyphomicrobiaceae bacterium]